MSYSTSVSLPPRLHEQALAATLHLVDEMQSHRPTIADVAARLDIPQSSLRTLFKDDTALLIAAAEQALVILIDNCTRAVVKVDPDDPVAQFVALGDVYIEWAGRHQAEFRLLSDSRLLDSLQTPALRRYLDSLANLMLRMLSRAKDQGRLHPREDTDMLALSARSFAFGVARMIVDGRMEEWAPGRDPVEAGKHLTRDFVRRMARSSQPQNTLNDL
ncbi:MAG: TetR/AcrR family transcriptional regulator [Paracoccus sp. (in: a-proteobacteria)]